MDEAGVVLKRARQATGLTQAQLAQRAHVTQSMISSYESGRRQPSLPTLRKIVESAGLRLRVDVEPADRVPRDLSGPLGLRIRQHRNELLEALSRHGLTNPRIFGSVARGAEHPESDVDILIDAPGDVGLFALLRAQGELSSILGAPVDLVPTSSLKSTVQSRITSDLVAL